MPAKRPADPALLFIKPGAICADDKNTLKEIGVVVIEIDDPRSVKFVRASAELSSTDLLGAAAQALLNSNYDAPKVDFAKRVAKLIVDGALAEQEGGE